ncbi:hypothetical protein AGMMS50293_17470 [Spirochaetia bacterium]|nr:hypothetical protein AGMMS50293_17470 [Spirochaetia bacterium]
MGLLIQVVKSWQVIAVTVAIVLYMSLVSYVARMYHRPHASRSKSKKKQKAAPAAAGPEETGIGSDSNDELGLEEA